MTLGHKHTLRHVVEQASTLPCLKPSTRRRSVGLRNQRLQEPRQGHGRCDGHVVLCDRDIKGAAPTQSPALTTVASH
eukprot:3430528-Prorocentrum_lima.AAC.1